MRGWLADGANKSQLDFKKYTRLVGLGTTTPASKLHVNGAIAASSFVKSGGNASQYLLAN